MGKYRAEFTTGYTSIRSSVSEQAVPVETGNQKCMGKTHFKSMVNSPKEN